MDTSHDRQTRRRTPRTRLPRLPANRRAAPQDDGLFAARQRSPELVNDHDFRSDAEGLAIPYGIYDLRANAGTVFVGSTADTPAFAVDCIEEVVAHRGPPALPRSQNVSATDTACG